MTSSFGDWDSVFARAGVVSRESVISARWSVGLEGLVNLDHPAAVQAGLGAYDTGIILPVHLLKHPTAGLFVIDSGITDDQANGGNGPMRGLLPKYLGTMVPAEGLGSILARQDAPVAGTIVTHAHADHVLGLPDLPRDSPIWFGPDELDAKAAINGLLRSTYKAIFDGHQDVRTLDPATAIAMAPFPHAWDLVGDGSIWAVWTPGHTIYAIRRPS
jgi:glyoxylase-like metal-dependent hydrolase (beta-lactamase superfamily II)